jgi:hypothetical protein
LGGSGTPDEVVSQIASDLRVPEHLQSELLPSGEPRYRNQVAWARFYLVCEGLIDSSKRGVWSLTERGRDVNLSDQEARAVFLKWVRIFQERRKARLLGPEPAPDQGTEDLSAGIDPFWSDEVNEFGSVGLDGLPNLRDPEGLDSVQSDGWGGEYPLDSVFVRTEQRTVREVVRRVKNERFELNPDFQREFVWSPEKQSRLIESCLMRIPLPVFYVAEARDGRIIVVDGLQRLSTFRRYLDAEFRLAFSRSEDAAPHPLEGKRFMDLEVKLRERVEDTQLTLYILDSKAPERAKLDIFERVNSGEPLTRQQMRNCLYNGPATRWLKSASEGEPFLRATGGSLDRKRMRDREAINRFCAFWLLGWQKYPSGDMDSFLADTLTKMNGMGSDELLALRQRFDASMDANFALFEKHAFRKSLAGDAAGNRSVLNIALFDVCSVALARLDPGDVGASAEVVRRAIRGLIGNSRFEHAVTYSTNSRKQVALRFEMIQEALEGVPK